MSSLQYYWILNIISYSLHWFHHQQFFGHNDMVMFFFPLSFFAFLVCFFGFHYLRHSQLSFFPILGDFMRYLVRILIDSIINDSLAIMTWLYSSFLYLSLHFLFASLAFHYLRHFQLSFFPFWAISWGTWWGSWLGLSLTILFTLVFYSRFWSSYSFFGHLLTQYILF